MHPAAGSPCCWGSPSGHREESIPRPLPRAGRGHCTMLGFGIILIFSGFCHSNPQGYLHTFALHGDTVSLHLQAVDSILFQQDKFHLSPVALAGFGTSTGHGRFPLNRPTKAIQPRAALRWEKACEDAKSFVVNQKCDLWCRQGSCCGHTRSPPSPMPASPPSLAGRRVGVQHADPFWLLAGLGGTQGPFPAPVPPSPGLRVTLSPPGSCRAQAQTLPHSHSAWLLGRLLGAVL